MNKMLVFDNGHEGSGRLVACVDTLGDAKRLTLVDEWRLKLETDRGFWVLNLNVFEPPFSACCFTDVELPSLPGRRVLYFDLRIAAALLKAKISPAHGNPEFRYEVGKDIPLFRSPHAG